jgi:hypothetical protein
LLKGWACEFNGFEVIKLALLEGDAEVLQDGRQTTRKCWGCLEGLDDLYSGQNSLAKIIRESLKYDTEKKVPSGRWQQSLQLRHIDRPGTTVDTA